MQSINLTPILQAVIGLLAALITYRLIPWIKARTTNEQQAYIRALVKAGVFAAEQVYKAGNGELKLQYVKDYLAERGIDVNVTEIEAAVAEHLNFAVPAAMLTVDADISPEMIDDGK